MSDTQSPLLSDAQLSFGFDFTPNKPNPQAMTPFAVRAFYEAKIASGELMVVKTVRLIQKHPGGPPISNTEVPMNCPNCRAFDVPSKTQWWKFCPGCNSRILP